MTDFFNAPWHHFFITRSYLLLIIVTLCMIFLFWLFPAIYWPLDLSCYYEDNALILTKALMWITESPVTVDEGYDPNIS